MTQKSIKVQDKDELKQARWDLLEEINRLTEKPMIGLSFGWLGLLILDFTVGLGPFLNGVSYAIWALFILDFVLRLLVAPHKLGYLKRNWLTVISLLLPALRILRIFPALRVLLLARTARSISLIRFITSLNRGIRAVNKAMGRRGVGYVLVITVIVLFAGAAGMAQFESASALAEEGYTNVNGLNSYSEAIWWTAMILTTMGSEYWPKTLEGRILAWLLALYAFAIFGYITATIASLFIGQNSTNQKIDGEEPSASPTMQERELSKLRNEVAVLNSQLTSLIKQLSIQGNNRTFPDQNKE